MRQFMRVAGVALVALLLAGSLAAQDTGVCTDEAQDYASRLADCSARVEAAQGPATKAAAFEDLARLHADNGAVEAALAAYDAGLALDPAREGLLRGKGYLLRDEGRLDEAQVVAERLVAAHPDYGRGLYLLGDILRRREDYATAREMLEKSAALSPRFFWGWWRLGEVDEALGETDEAATAFARAAELDLLELQTLNRAYHALKDAGRMDEAARYGRMSFTLNPNQLRLRDELAAYVGDDTPPDMAPLDWTPPSEATRTRYFRVLAPVDTRDEMELSIRELEMWFTGQPLYFLPEGSALVETLVGAERITGDFLTTSARTTKTDGLPRTPSIVKALFRGTFTAGLQPIGPGTPVIVPEYGESSPADIWPLAAGNSAQGTALYIGICPEKGNMPSILMGCLAGVETVERGRLDWRIEVEGTERLHVPLGVFDTWVLNYVQTGEITILGKTRQVSFVQRFWLSPDLGAFVMRKTVSGGQYLLDQALDRLPAGEG